MIKVLTAIANNYTDLRDDQVKGNAEFLAYTELGTKSDLWEVKQITNNFIEPRRNAKLYKVLPHLFTDAEWIIWLDGNISLKIPPEQLIEEWGDDVGCTVPKHFGRNCLYEEAEECSNSSLDYKHIIAEQVKHYEKMNIPKKMGLGECNIMIRKNTPEVNRRNELWWAEICRGSGRDQISFPYAFRDAYRTIPINPRNHPYFNFAVPKGAQSRIYDNRNLVQCV